MPAEQTYEGIGDIRNEEERAESERISLRDPRGRLEWLSKHEEKEVSRGMKIDNNARVYLEFLSGSLEGNLKSIGPRPENRNGFHLLKMLEGIAEDFGNLELTDAQRKLIAQVVDELERRALDDRNEEDPHLREDMNARVMQLYTFLNTIEGNAPSLSRK